ncbi:MAG: alpha/beta hydrolase [Pseudomonadota bacterium]
MPYLQTSDDCRLYYTDTGDGHPILCLAGLTRNSTDFDYVAPHLSEARLICLDYRGRGQSDWADPSTYTLVRESQDALELMDHLGLEQVAILGTSRGGLIAMILAATAKARLIGVMLNDIGPVIDPAGLEIIKGYLGRNPAAKTKAEAVAMRASLLKGFENVPESRWAAEVDKHYTETPDGLQINYDPKLRDAVLAASVAPDFDPWQLFAALDDLPLGCIRGANSDLLSAETLEKMYSLRPDMIAATVADRGHVPFLDEPEALAALKRWMDRL